MQAPPQTEREFMHAVIDLAYINGWMVHHVIDQHHYAKRIGPGFPDLVLCRPWRDPKEASGPTLIFVELKSEKGTVRVDQQEWLDKLTEATAIGTARVCVWRPSDWSEIEGTLRKERQRDR